jgi:hypothetical protein
MLRLFASVTCIVVAACGGGNGSPTAPSTPARATLTISAFTVTASTLAAGGFSYRAVFQLRETGGRMGATILTIRFTQQDGRFANVDPTSPLAIAAGATIDSGPIALTDTAATTPTAQFTLSIGYRDEGGQAGDVSMIASVPPPAAPPPPPPPSPPPPPANVEYRVTGGTIRANLITYSGRGETTLQDSHVDLPWSYTFTPIATGDFLYVSAQNDLPTGCIKVQIFRRGSLYREGESCGAYVIATASGSY